MREASPRGRHHVAHADDKGAPRQPPDGQHGGGRPPPPTRSTVQAAALGSAAPAAAPPPARARRAARRRRMMEASHSRPSTKVRASSSSGTRKGSTRHRKTIHRLGASSWMKMTM